MVKIFFACSMRGEKNRVDQNELRKIPDLVKEKLLDY